MKLIKKMRKGFTLIELVVVIAVIAVLAAVSVVSYVAITNKAKRSADEQAVAQMNTVLKAESISKATTIDVLYAVLDENGLSAKNYNPLMKGTYFFWDQEDNTIVYAESKNGSYVGIYPAEYKGKTKADGHHWFSLNGAIEEKKVTAQDSVYTVDSAEELYYLSKNNKVAAGETVKLEAENIDLMGADIHFSFATASSETYKLQGKEGGTTLSGLVQNENKIVSDAEGDNNGKAYYSGLVQQVATGTKVVIKDITVENMVAGDLETGSVGAIVGVAGGNGSPKADIEFDNVHIKNSIINGKNKVGGFIGSCWGATVKINDNCSITNTTINCSEGEAGMLIGVAFAGSNITIGNNVDTTGTTTKLVEGKVKRAVIDASSFATGLVGGVDTALNPKVDSMVEKMNVNSTTGEVYSSNQYRLFYKDAKLVFAKDTTGSTATNKVNNVSYIGEGKHLVLDGKTVSTQSYTVPVVPAAL